MRTQFIWQGYAGFLKQHSTKNFNPTGNGAYSRQLVLQKEKKKETGHLSRKYASNQTTVSAQLLQAQPFGAGELTFRRFDLEVSGQLQNPVFPKLGANKPPAQGCFQVSTWRANTAKKPEAPAGQGVQTASSQ